MRLFRELSEENKGFHVKVAKGLVPGQTYQFPQPVTAWVLLSSGEPLAVTRGRFVRWRNSGHFNDCLFRVRHGDDEVIVSVFFTRDGGTPKEVTK